MRYHLLFAMLALAASEAAGCSPSSLSRTCNGNCPLVGTCPISDVMPKLLYPIPDAANVPTTSGSLLFSGQLPKGFSAELIGGASTLSLAFGPAPSPLPSPRVAAPAGAVLAGAPYPALAAKTKYSVYYDFSDSSCSGLQLDGSSFSTK